MNSWFRNIRLKNYEKEAKAYLEDKYIKPTFKIGSDGTEAASCNFGSKSEESDVKYSSRGLTNNKDSYDPDEIRHLIEFMNENKDVSEIDKKLCELLNQTFVDRLIIYIREKNLKDPEVYKAAHIDRRLFSKIMSDKNYKPSKDTAVALILSLRLTVDEANDMLERAGYTLSHSNKRDVIIEYFISRRIFDIDDINEILYRLDQKVIGG